MSANKTVSIQENDSEELLCGCYNFHPKFLQKFARPLSYGVSISCLFLAQSSLTAGYLSAIITTLEKRYDLSTSQIGFMLSSYDITAVFAAFLISYYGDQFNRAKVLGYGGLLMALGSLMFSLPQFVGSPYGKYDTIQNRGAQEESPNQTFVSFSNLCNATAVFQDAGTFLEDDTDVECVGGYSPQLWALALFIIAQLVLSVGASPLFILGPTYLYDNVPQKSYALYAGISYSMVAMGPAAGFLIGAVFIKIYVDPWKTPPGASEEDRHWVGAWWIGLLSCTGFILLASFPLLLFPRRLPGMRELEEKREKEEAETQNDDDSKPMQSDLGHNFTDIPTRTRKLLSNPTFLFATMTMVMEASMSSGFIAFIAKYFEVSFDIEPSRANIITGAVIIPGAVAGILTGGALMRSLQLPVCSIAKFLLALGFLPLVGVTVLLFLGCNTVTMAGITTDYSMNGNKEPPDMLYAFASSYKENLTDKCNVKCGCSSDAYQPVCGEDGISYFSPCHAGCADVHYNPKRTHIMNFTECNCIFNGLFGNSSYAEPGKCSDNCVNAYPAMATLFIVIFLTCVGHNPILLITLRSVSSHERSFAMGIQNIVVRVLAQIPAPIYYGIVFDSECILWTESCGVKGACLEYNIEKLPFVLFGVCLATKFLSYLFIIFTYVAAEREEQKEKARLLAQEFPMGFSDPPKKKLVKCKPSTPECIPKRASRGGTPKGGTPKSTPSSVAKSPSKDSVAYGIKSDSGSDKSLKNKEAKDTKVDIM